MKRCIVTGGLGFIGSHLVDELVAMGHDVIVVDILDPDNISYRRHDIAYHSLDMLDEEKLKSLFLQFQPNWVFHLAAKPQIQASFEEPAHYDDANVKTCIILATILKSLRSIEALVYSSSAAVYGNTQEIPTTETAPINPLSPYGLQKYAGERYLHILGEYYGIPVTTLRYFNVYGPRSYVQGKPNSAYSSVVGIFNEQKITQKPLTITGNGKQSRDFIHVSDVAKANCFLANNIQQTRGEVYNLGTGVGITVEELAALFGGEIERIPERAGDILISQADITKIKQLGWEPTITIEQAIESQML